MWGWRKATGPRYGSTPDGRLRFVLFRPSGSTFTIDAVVADAGSGRLGDAGATVTLRLHRPTTPDEDVDVEKVLRRWAEEDRLVDVTLAEETNSSRHPANAPRVTALQAEGSKMRLHLVA